VSLVVRAQRDVATVACCFPQELESYQPGLSLRPSLLVVNKMDIKGAVEELRALAQGLRTHTSMFHIHSIIYSYTHNPKLILSSLRRNSARPFSLPTLLPHSPHVSTEGGGGRDGQGSPQGRTGTGGCDRAFQCSHSKVVILSHQHYTACRHLCQCWLVYHNITHITQYLRCHDYHVKPMRFCVL